MKRYYTDSKQRQESDLKMIRTFPLPVVYFKRLPPLFCFSIGALLAVIITAFVLGERATQKHIDLIDNYGTVMVEWAAQDAAGPIVSHNLVGLHAVMLDVVEQPRVRVASVHDVEQVLLVQAGAVAPQGDDLIFSAPIPLNESMGGYVTISMDVSYSGESALQWALIGISILLLVMASLALYEARGDAWVLKSRSFGSERALDDSSESTGLDERTSLRELEPIDAEEVVPNWMYADLILVLSNYSRLEQQLSDVAFSRRVTHFERQLNDILALYGGSQMDNQHSGGVYNLRFKSVVSRSEAIFGAICSAFLIQSTEQKNKIRFHLLAHVCTDEGDLRLGRSILGIFVQSHLIDDFLRERLVLATVEGERMLVTGLKGTYALLLESQTQQLQSFSIG